MKCSIYNYIDKYEDYSFSEKPYNEIDMVILSQIVYADFTGIVGRKKCVLTDAITSFLKKEEKRIKPSVLELITRLNNTKRYGSLKVFNYVYKLSDSEQFGAISIELTNKIRCIVFEGTDTSIIGVKEDFAIAYKFPTLAQKDAMLYLKKNYNRFKKLIVLGHSKGGNLALVASMYAPLMIRRSIIHIFSFDGPGLRKSEYYSDKYNRIKRKYTKYIQKNSIIGRLLYDDRDEIIVDCFRKGFSSHDIVNWKYEDNVIKRATLNKFSVDSFNTIQEWFTKYDDNELEEFSKHIFEVFDNAGIGSIYDLKDMNKDRLFLLVSGIKKIDSSAKDMIVEFIDIVKNYYFNN